MFAKFSVDTTFSPVVVSLPLSPSRKSSRLQAANPVTPPSASAVTGRKEATILARVAQLQKEGRWVFPKKMVKAQPPARPKTHWYKVSWFLNCRYF